MKAPKIIVAEVSKNWPESPTNLPRFLSERFEAVINTNLERGYRLQSWQLNRVGGLMSLNETIIAVFVRDKEDESSTGEA